MIEKGVKVFSHGCFRIEYQQYMLMHMAACKQLKYRLGC
jgi:hypothetical protein